MIAVMAHAASSFVVRGRVLDASAGQEPVPFASVAVVNTSFNAVTDDNGGFEINIPVAGKYKLRVAMVGYAEVEESFAVGADGRGAVADLQISLHPSIEHMDEIVVSATRNAVRRSEAPVVVSVLGPKLFDAVQSTDLAATLSYQSGLRVESNCQNCGFPQVRINGLEGPYSQILINSRPVVSSLSGVYALEQMPVSMIDRIEVVRGGGSALFGANAVGGTINVITKDALNNGFDASTTVSNLDGRAWEENVSANASVVAPSGNYGLAFYESYRHRNPYDRDGDSFSELGKLVSNSLGFNGFYRFSDTQRLTLEYHNTNEFRRGGNKFDLEPFMTDITEQTRHDINSGGLNYVQSWRDYRYRLNAYASAQHIDRSSYYGAGMNPDAYGRTDDFTFVGGATFTGEFPRVLVSPAVFTAGVEYQSNRLHDVMTGYGRNLSQNVDVYSAFAQNEWKMTHFTLLAGLRFDKHNLIKNPIVSPRVNLLYRPFSALQARMTWSTGFRAPQAYDEDLHVTAVGGEAMIIRLAEGLKPERSNSFSASVDYDFRIGDVDADILAEGFYTELRDVFVLEALGSDAEGVMVKERRNGNGARVYGANIDLSFTYRSYDLRCGFTAQRSLYRSPESWSENPDVPPTREMPRAPRLYGYFTLTAQPVRNLECSLSGIYTGRLWVPHYAPAPEDIPADYPYPVIASDELFHSPNFMEVNLKVAYTAALRGKLKMQIGAGVTNIGNAFQRNLDRGELRDSGFFYGPTRPRTYFVSLRFFSF